MSRSPTSLRLGGTCRALLPAPLSPQRSGTFSSFCLPLPLWPSAFLSGSPADLSSISVVIFEFQRSLGTSIILLLGLSALSRF